MTRHFDPSLVNDPFDDPGLYVDLVFERRALLFDLGDLARLVPRKLLRISNVFVTHRHMDHFIGFDQLLRRRLGREKVLCLYGPAGTIDAVEGKLSAYSWNLIDGYGGNLVFRVTDIDPTGSETTAEFSGRRWFKRSESMTKKRDDGVILEEVGLRVRATTLDHGVDVLAFALEERAQINVWRNKVEAMGLSVGPWLRGFKQAILRGGSDEDPIDVTWADGQMGRPATLPLGQLKQEIMQVTEGRRISYVIDCAFTDANIEKIIRLAQGSDVLFIEAMFLDADAVVAERRRHLTARQAGTLARLAAAKRLVTLHYRHATKGTVLALPKRRKRRS